jgi:hypothetical protein
VTTSDDDEALRLNTLHRFRKHSPRLLLQEYSHCEVPAGCGGVVLRWIDRQGGLPTLVRFATLGRVRCWIDGVAPNSSRVELMPGPHVLAVEVAELARANTPMLALIAVNLPRNDETLIRSGADSGWWVTDSQPGEGWMQHGFDAQRHGWSRAPSHPNYEPEIPENKRWHWSSLARNARPLALPGGCAWLRHEFELSTETIARCFVAAEDQGRG